MRGSFEMHEKMLRALAKLESDEACERSDGIEELVASEDESIRPKVRSFLNDPSELVRMEAIDCLAEWGDKESVPGILACLDDPDVLVRNYAACALGSMGVQELVPLARERLSDPSLSDLERQGYQFALYNLGDPSYLLPFINGLFSDDYVVQCSTANTLEDLWNRDNYPFFRNLLRLLLTTNPPRAVSASYESVIQKMAEEFGDSLEAKP